MDDEAAVDAMWRLYAPGEAAQWDAAHSRGPGEVESPAPGDVSLGQVASLRGRSQSLPKRVLIRSVVDRYRRQEKEALARFETEFDIPGILKEIESTDKEAKRREEQMMAALDRMGEAPPEAPTTLQTTVGEGAAGLIAMLAGVPGYEASDAVAGTAQARQDAAFGNAVRAWQARVQKEGRQFEVAQRQSEAARREAQALREYRRRVQGQVAGTRLERGLEEAAFERQLGIQLLDAMRQEELLAQKMEFEAAAAAAEREFKLKLRAMDRADKMNDAQATAIFDGLKRMEDPETVRSALAALAAMRFEVPPAMARTFEGLADVNRKTREHKQLMERIGLQLQGQAQALQRDRFGFDLAREGYKRLPGSIPGSGEGFVPLDPMGPGVSVAGEEGSAISKEFTVPGPRPNAGKGEQDLQQLVELAGRQIGLKRRLKALEEQMARQERLFTTLIGGRGGSASDFAKQAVQAGLDKTLEPIRNEIEKVKTELAQVGQVRRARIDAVRANAGPQYKAWLEAVRRSALQRIKEIGENKGLGPHKGKLQDAVREEYFRLTGEEL